MTPCHVVGVLALILMCTCDCTADGPDRTEHHASTRPASSLLNYDPYRRLRRDNGMRRMRAVRRISYNLTMDEYVYKHSLQSMPFQLVGDEYLKLNEHSRALWSDPQYLLDRMGNHSLMMGVSTLRDANGVFMFSGTIGRRIKFVPATYKTFRSKLDLNHHNGQKTMQKKPKQTKKKKEKTEKKGKPKGYYAGQVSNLLFETGVIHDLRLPLFLREVLEALYMSNTHDPHWNFWESAGGANSGLHNDDEDGLIFQMVGTKRVIMFPPWETQFVYPVVTNKETPHRSPIDLFDPAFNITRYPLLRHASPYHTTLHPGEILLIPAGWWHAVLSSGPHNIAASIWLRDTDKTSLTLTRHPAHRHPWMDSHHWHRGQRLAYWARASAAIYASHRTTVDEYHHHMEDVYCWGNPLRRTSPAAWQICGTATPRAHTPRVDLNLVDDDVFPDHSVRDDPDM